MNFPGLKQCIISPGGVIAIQWPPYAIIYSQDPVYRQFAGSDKHMQL
jgi:hypothetical protein